MESSGDASGETQLLINDLRRQLSQALEFQQRQSQRVADILQRLADVTEDNITRRHSQLNDRDASIRRRQNALQLEGQRLEEERRHFVEICEARVQRVLTGEHPAVIYIEVGGQHFETTPATLMAHPESCTLTYAFFKAVEYNPSMNTIRVDRNPKHFDKILDYMRYSEASLVWLDDPCLSSWQLKEMKTEAQYYGLPGLVLSISWSLIALKPRVAFLSECGDCFRAVRRERSPNGNDDSETTQGYETRKNQCLKEPLNFTDFVFESIMFKNCFSFKGCVLKDAMFKDCTFKAEIDVTEANIEGIKFEGCSGILPPKDVFYTCNTKGSKCIPIEW